MKRAAIFGLMGVLAVVGPPIGLSSTSLAGDSEVRECGSEHVLRRIVSRFRYQVRHVPELPDVQIESFGDIHQHRYLAAHDHRPIARRYCHATAFLSDGRSRKVWYLIEDGLGFASFGDNVEFCVSGFDRWMVYNGGCRVLR